MHVLSYVDDTHLVVHPTHLAEALHIIEEELAAVQWSLKRAKCKSWIRGAEEVNPSVDLLVPQSLEGLPLLGTALAGEYELLLGPFGVAAQAVGKRAEAAKHFAAQLKLMTKAVLRVPVLQSVWKLVHGSLSKALDFDLRILHEIGPARLQ